MSNTSTSTDKITITTKNNNRNNKKSKNRRRRIRKNGNKRVAKQALPEMFHVSSCAKLYMKALVDPFNVQGAPCIPDTIILPSYKYRTFLTSSFGAGIGGTGWIAFDPWQALFNDLAIGPTFTQGSIYYTIPGVYADTGFNYTNTTTPIAGVFATNPSTMFNSSQFNLAENSLNRYRLVAAGLRVRYTGSTFNNQGVITQCRVPNNLNAPFLFNPTDAMRQQYSRQSPIKKNVWKYVYYQPENPEDFDYIGSDGLPGYTGTQSSNYCLLLFLSGCEPGAPFQFEMTSHFEVIGPNVPITKSHSDPAATTAVMSAMPVRAPEGSPSQEMPIVVRGFLESMGDLTGNAVSNIGNSLMDVAKDVGPSLIKSLLVV
jgi:hypothetical protein